MTKRRPRRGRKTSIKTYTPNRENSTPAQELARIHSLSVDLAPDYTDAVPGERHLVKDRLWMALGTHRAQVLCKALSDAQDSHNIERIREATDNLLKHLTNTLPYGWEAIVGEPKVFTNPR